jgi:hypothetical protein
MKKLKRDGDKMKKAMIILVLALATAGCQQQKKAEPQAAEPAKVRVQDLPAVKTELEGFLTGHWAGQSNHFYFNKNKTFRTTFAGKPWTYGKWKITGANNEAAEIKVYMYDERATVEADAVLKTVPGYSKTGEGVGQETFLFHFSGDRQEIVVYDETDKVVKDNLSFVGEGGKK